MCFDVKTFYGPAPKDHMATSSWLKGSDVIFRSDLDVMEREATFYITLWN
jgi:hypothetical protein